MSLLGAPVVTKKKDEGDEAHGDEEDVLLDEVAHADDEGRQEGQFGAEVAEDRGEDGNDLPEQENGDDDGEDDDGHRVDHRLFDLAPQPDVLLDELGQAAEHDVEGARLLARGDEVAVEVVEGLGVLPFRLVQGRAGLDVILDGLDDFLEISVFLLFLEDAQALDERQLGVDEDGQLAAVDGQVFEPDLLPLEEGDGEAPLGRGDAEDRDLVLLEEAPHLFLGRGDALAADRVTVAVFPFPNICRHCLPRLSGPGPYFLDDPAAPPGVILTPSWRWMMSVSSSGKDVMAMTMSRVTNLR